MRHMNISDEAVEAAVDALVGSTLGDRHGINGEEFVEAARLALEAAAPHLMAPRVLSAVDELDDLPEGAMVRTDAGFYLKEALRHGISTWVTTNEQYYFKTDDIPLPATVIYNPHRSAGAGE
jgi:hypothetical protein